VRVARQFHFGQESLAQFLNFPSKGGLSPRALHPSFRLVATGPNPYGPIKLPGSHFTWQVPDSGSESPPTPSRLGRLARLSSQMKAMDCRGPGRPHASKGWAASSNIASGTGNSRSWRRITASIRARGLVHLVPASKLY
jgi:hypothetical protein